MGRKRRNKTKECDQMEGGWGGAAVKDGGQEVEEGHSETALLTLPLDLLFALNAAVAVVITAADVTV